jgi:nucleotidyltransferase substrate binding protein (TIGR01987 family)
MTLNTQHLMRTISTLEQAMIALKDHGVSDDIMFDLYRNAAFKSFELSLETTGKLLRKVLKLYIASPREVDSLSFNDVIRHSFKYGILDNVSAERWLKYRLNRNNTAHDYGEGFANETVKILPDYIQDATEISKKIQGIFDAQA